jgi:Rrf2 family protein
MIRVSSKGRYAVRALSDVAFHGASAPAQLKDVARRQRIPLRFLEQIFQDLRREGLVASKRGPRGGYQLARPAAEICVGDVLRATGGAARGPVGRQHRAQELREVCDQVIDDLTHDMEACFAKVTLADVCARAEQAGVRHGGRASGAYVI